MKKHRRIEITAFRRRIMVVSGNRAVDTDETDVVIVNNSDSLDVIETASDEGQEILTEAIRLLEERIGKPARQTIEPSRLAAFDTTNEI